MFRKIIVLAVLCLCFLPAMAMAQTPLKFSAVEVDLWPEYDRPNVLVIYRVTLDPQSSLPVEVRLGIPAQGGAPNAVAARHPDGSLYNLNYTQESAGIWNVLVFQATAPELQIEYYDSSLQKDGERRSFEYTWPGEYAADSFLIQVQQPKGAGQMSISPSLGAGVTGSDGLDYFTSQVGPLAAGQSFSIDVTYQKPDDRLSVESVPIEASGPLDDSATGRWTINSALPYVLGIFGLALIGGGAYWYWQSGQEQDRPRRKRGARRKAGPAGGGRATAQHEGMSAGSGQHIYCHQCGKRAASGDRFCRVCGTQLRTG